MLLFLIGGLVKFSGREIDVHGTLFSGILRHDDPGVFEFIRKQHPVLGSLPTSQRQTVREKPLMVLNK